MHELIEYLKQYDLFMLLTLGTLIWYLLKGIEKALNVSTKSIETKIDALDKDMRIMNTRISRIEGTVYGKEVYKHIDENKGDS